MQTDRPRTSAATRIDANGTTERIEFRGREGERIFSSLYLPASDPLGAVLICPPLHSEFTKNYRREVLVARRLAERGYAVARFHYRGTGNSDGEGRDVTFDTMRDDAAASLEDLEANSGRPVSVVMGTRWGALIAAATVSSSRPETALVLWEPLLDASQFFRSAFRTRLVHDRKMGIERPPTGDELARRLQAGEAVDIVGHTIEQGLYTTSLGRTVDGELAGTPRAILLVQIGPSTTVRSELTRQSDRWRADGFHVDVEVVEGDESWWFIDDRYQDEGRRPMTKHLLDLTSSWIARVPAGGVR